MISPAEEGDSPLINLQLLALSLVLSYLSAHSHLIEKPIIKWLNQLTRQEMDLVARRNELKDEQRQLNMADNFARYSKIQRQINTIDEKLKTFKGSKPLNSDLMRIAMTYGIKFVLGFVLVVFSVLYRHTPVFSLSKNIDLVPFTWLVCYPNGPNLVSLHFWIMCCTAVARRI